MQEVELRDIRGRASIQPPPERSLQNVRWPVRRQRSCVGCGHVLLSQGRCCRQGRDPSMMASITQRGCIPTDPRCFPMSNIRIPAGQAIVLVAAAAALVLPILNPPCLSSTDGNGHRGVGSPRPLRWAADAGTTGGTARQSDRATRGIMWVKRSCRRQRSAGSNPACGRPDVVHIYVRLGAGVGVVGVNLAAERVRLGCVATGKTNVAVAGVEHHHQFALAAVCARDLRRRIRVRVSRIGGAPSCAAAVAVDRKIQVHKTEHPGLDRAVALR